MRAMLKRLQREEDGQALLYGVGVIVITVTLFYGAMDVGLLVLGKIQAQTAVDAAALSATAVKAGVHNTRSLAYRAQTGQIALARTQLARATALALQALTKGQVADRAKFQEAIGLAGFHRENVADLRSALVAYNAWVGSEEVGPATVKQAAQLAYLGNIGVLGLNDANKALIKRNQALAEFAESTPLIGGTAFREEGILGSGGKSHVAVEPQVGVMGGGLLGYGTSAALKAMSTAGPLDARAEFGDLASLRPVGGYGINWYTVRIQAIGAKTEKD